MKKLYRYMSLAEFYKYSAGLEIIGKKHFKARTSSTGVCFLGEKTPAIGESYTYSFDPEDCYGFLAGIVSKDVLVEFETEVEVREGVGVYAEPQGGYWDLMSIPEYSVDSYSRDTFRATAYCVDFTPTTDNYKLGRKVKWYSL